MKETNYLRFMGRAHDWNTKEPKKLHFKTEFERSKKVDDLRRQGKTTDMFKTMFGQG